MKDKEAMSVADLAAQLPDWNAMGRGVRSNVRGALLALGCRSVAELEALPEATADRLLTDRWRRCGYRTIREQLLHRSRRRRGDLPSKRASSYKATWFVRLPGAVRAALSGCTAAQLDLLHRLRFPHLRGPARANIASALRVAPAHCCASEADLRVLRPADLRPAKVHTYATRRITSGFNHLFRLCGRVDRWEFDDVARHLSPSRTVTRAETAWLAAQRDPVLRDWYLALKDEVATAEPGLPDEIRRHALWLCRHLAETHGPHPERASADRLRDAVVACSLASVRDNKCSLIGQGRQSRGPHGRRGAAGMGVLRRVCRAARWVADRWKRADAVVTADALWPAVRNALGRADAELVEFSDVVAGHDVAAMVAACVTDTERLLVLLACRLGMRLGAINHLRLAGVVSEASLDAAGAEWCVRPWISAWDKGDRVNHFPLNIAPDLPDALRSYLVRVWRPTYGDARTDDGALRCQYLFPGRDWRDRPDKPLSGKRMRAIIVGVMHRVGIAGPRAHPHALRKGFCTDLLRAGNKPEVVARAMHHRSIVVTYHHYDKRSDEELLRNLVLPEHWRATEEDKGTTAASTEASEGETAALALEEEMQMNDVLRQQHAILWALLPAEARERYRAQCADRGLPCEAPLPPLTS